ncbi:hypothetical protein GCM10010911_71760 [Paenibacillus nasutitermitis]|uniref:Uncharacterized protein n=1 Tax=Paenibacillus nasutitermitis TaxID=1652958 RepID=A0A917E4H3_9BACL|nr:hypothetical protein GCM10010911_71760 [Paenibacillus nasutitermitis]
MKKASYDHVDRRNESRLIGIKANYNTIAPEKRKQLFVTE